MHDSDFDTNQLPLAYLITVRCFGTWLHGDERLAVDRHGLNVYGRQRRPANAKLQDVMRLNMRQEPILLNDNQRAVVAKAISEVCLFRQYRLSAISVRTNHFHVVVGADSRPEPIADAFKSYATRKLRDAGLLVREVKPWARGKSRRYLWKPKHVARAIHYVLYEQGDIPDFDD